MNLRELLLQPFTCLLSFAVSSFILFIAFSFSARAAQKEPSPPRPPVVLEAQVSVNSPISPALRRARSLVRAISFGRFFSQEPPAVVTSPSATSDHRPDPEFGDTQYRRQRGGTLGDVHNDMLVFIRNLSQKKDRALFTIFSHSNTGALILLAAQNSQFNQAVRSYPSLPSELRRSFQDSGRYRAAFGAMPDSYRVTCPSDIDELPLSATLAESLPKVIYERNSLWITHVLLNLGLLGVTTAATASQSVLIPPVLLEGATAQVLEDNMLGVCHSVAHGDSFRISAPLVGSFGHRISLAGVRDAAAALIGAGIASIPTIGQNTFMPLIAAGVFFVLKTTMLHMQKREHQSHERETIFQLGSIINHLEMVVENQSTALIQSPDTDNFLATVAENPAQTLYIASALARLEWQEREQFMDTIIQVVESLKKPTDTGGRWTSLLHRILNIDPDPNVRPQVTSLANAIYHLIYNRKMAYVYVPLIMGIMVGLMIHIPSVVVVGSLAPHIGVVGSASAVIAPPANINATCAALGLNLASNTTVTEVLTGSLISVRGTGIGTFINLMAGQLVNIAMGGIYWPCQRLCSRVAKKVMSCINSCFFRRERLGADENDESFERLLEEHKSLRQPELPTDGDNNDNATHSETAV